jgi:hypothetical protein
MLLYHKKREALNFSILMHYIAKVNNLGITIENIKDSESFAKTPVLFTFHLVIWTIGDPKKNQEP